MDDKEQTGWLLWNGVVYDGVPDSLATELTAKHREIERLQRELADTVDMLKQCAGRNDEIESLNERLERDLSEAKKALLVPGVMSCAKCNFRLYRQNLYMQSGAVGPGGNETEPCPNGCGPLWPVTWKREASDNLTLAESAHADRAKAERERDEARARLEQMREAVDTLIRHLLKSPIRESGVGGMTMEESAARSFYVAKVPILVVEKVRAALGGEG